MSEVSSKATVSDIGKKFTEKKKKHFHTPSGRSMAPESTQPQTEMSTRDIFWGRG